MKLFQHQIDGINFAEKNKWRAAFFWDVGTGKTLAALKTFALARETNPKLQLLVVCPISLIESAWGDDIKKFTDFKYANLRETNVLIADILIINYEALISAKFKPVLTAITQKQIMCVLDESQRIKSYNAKTTKYLLALSKYFFGRIIMSATPAPNSELEYWSQMTFLNDTILGKNFFAYRNLFFSLSRTKSLIPLHGLGRREMMSLMQRGYELKITPNMKPQLQQRMKPYCQFIEKRDVLDLPDEINEVRYVQMTPEQRKHYNEMFKDLVTEIQGETIAVQNALTKIMKVRQITGGFMYYPEGVKELSPNNKMNELEDIINEIGQKKVIVFCQYKWEIETINQRFKRRAEALYGETKDGDSVIRRFKDSTAGIIVAHPLSAGVGLSFNDCDYMIFYSLDYSYMNYYQSRGRIMRAGKKNNATYIHLLTEKSIDMDIYSAIQHKESNDQIFKRIMKNG